MRWLSGAAALVFLVACHDRSDGSGQTGAPFVLAAGLDAVAPQGRVLPGGPYDLGRHGITHVDQAYRLTTPAGVPFAFDVMSRAADNAGTATVAIAHVADAGAVPAGGAETLAAAGCVPSGAGLASEGASLAASGDGFARMTVRGAIARTQVLAFTSRTAAGETVALVEVAIGPASPINQVPSTAGNDPGIVSSRTLYSSDSWSFGLPCIAVSGDRSSIVTYEGDRRDWAAYGRFELRMQHDRATDEVRGGGSVESNPDRGNWRDHEIAALYNVLAVVHSGGERITVKLSFDRGATFEQVREFGLGSMAQRLPQIAIAADYSLAVTWWQTGNHGASTELMLVEASPTAFDPNGSPTLFGFGEPQVVYRAGGDVSPMLTGMQWSEGGDLAIGYAASSFATRPDLTWVVRSEFRCAVRLHGGPLRDYLVDEEILVGRDPSVALLGSGPTLRIFYAYEGTDGIRLRTSGDAGATFSAATVVGQPAAHTPTVFARSAAAATRVDVLYVLEGAVGSELHRTHWSDFGNGPAVDHRLNTATMVETSSSPAPLIALPWGGTGFGLRVTQLAWLGYDATLDGDQIVVVYDEETFDASFLCMGAGRSGGGANNAASSPPIFNAAAPPPLAPGMQLPLPAAEPAHRHQLKLVRIQ